MIVFLHFDEENNSVSNQINLLSLGDKRESSSKITLPLNNTDKEIIQCIVVPSVDINKDDLIVFATKKCIYVQNVVTYNLFFDVRNFNMNINSIKYNDDNHSLFVILNDYYLIELSLQYQTISMKNYDILLKMLEKVQKNNAINVVQYEYFSSPNELTFSLSFIKEVTNFELISKCNKKLKDVKNNTSLIGVKFDRDKRIYILNYDNMIVQCQIVPDYGEIKYWSFYDNILFIGCEDDNLYVIDTNVFEVIFILEGHKNIITDLLCSKQVITSYSPIIKDTDFKQVTYRTLFNSKINVSDSLDTLSSGKGITEQYYKYEVITMGKDGLVLKWSFDYKEQNRIIDSTQDTIKQIKLIPIKKHKILNPVYRYSLDNSIPILGCCYNSKNKKLYTLCQRDVYNKSIEYKTYYLE